MKGLMTSVQRLKRAIHFQRPDRLPHFLPDGEKNDLAWLWVPGPSDIQDWVTLDDGRQRRVDAWGAVWETISPGSYGEAVKWPVQGHRPAVRVCIAGPE